MLRRVRREVMTHTYFDGKKKCFAAALSADLMHCLRAAPGLSIEVWTVLLTGQLTSTYESARTYYITTNMHNAVRTNALLIIL